MTCPFCQAENDDRATVCSGCGHALAPVPVIRPGFVLASRYEIQSALGKGGMGIVYKAHDRLLKETVAIKVLRADAAETPTMAQRFISEIKLARAVSHKNVCRIHEYGEDGGLRYISMAYVDGVDLKHVLHERGPLPPGEAYEISIRLAEGLQAIHDEGIVHRDLKTPNIMLDGRGVVRLMDFGIAKHFEEGTTGGVTGTGQIVGTPEYMSPEQIRGQKLDNRSDIYALGIVVFELFTGLIPFRGDTPVATILKQLQEPPPLEGPDAARLPRSLIPILEKALAKSPEERYATAKEMAKALEDARSAPKDPTLSSALEETAPMTEPALRASSRPTPVPFPSADLPQAPRTVTELAVPGPRRAAPAPGPPSPATRTAPTVQLSKRRGSARAVFAACGVGAMGLAFLGYYQFRGAAPGAVPPAVSPAAVASQLAAAPAGLSPSPLAGPPSPLAAPASVVAEPQAPPATTKARPPAPEAGGHASAALRSAQAALSRGDYAAAAAQAQAALGADPANVAAREVLGEAQNGQKAQAHYRAAEAAIERGDYAEASSRVEAGRLAAPRDPRGAELASKIRDLQQRSRRQAEGQVEAFLRDAEKALEGQKYDAAIALYDEALKLDQQNAIARMGRATAVNARVTARAASGDPSPGVKSFVASRTVAESAETKADKTLSESFAVEGMEITKDTQAADLPGRIEFGVQPAAVRPGDKYTVSIAFVNGGRAPIDLQEMVVTTTINGKKVSGGVPLQVKTVGPGQRGLVLSTSDYWREDVRSWSLEALVRTTRGESYRSQVVWK